MIANQVRQPVVWEQAEYEIETGDGPQPHAVEFCYGEGLLAAERGVVLLPGLGEGKSTMAMVAGELSQQPLAVVDLVFPDISPEGIEQTIKAAAVAVGRRINEIKQTDICHNIAGMSMGGGLALKAFSLGPEDWQDLALITPFGLTNRLLGEDIKARQREVFGRFKANKKVLAADDVSNAVESPADATLSIRSFGALSRYGLEHEDGVQMLQRVVDLGRRVVVGVAEHDPIFPLPEVETALGERLKHLVTRLSGRHYSFAAPGGREQIATTVDALLEPEVAKRAA
jgi:pimeloyl-ACP methyl ester carboxylesterase